MSVLRELIAKFDVEVTGAAGLTKTLQTMGVGEQKARTLGKSFDVLKKLVPVAAVGLATRQLTAWIREATEAADVTQELAEQLGFTAQGLQEWGVFAQMAGGRASDFTKITAKLGDTVNAAMAGPGKQRALLEDLGVAYQDASGNALELEEVLLNSAVAIGKIQNPTERLTVANELLGKGGRRLANSFKGSREEMQAQLKAMGELGGVYSEEFLTASGEVNDELEATARQFDVLRSEIVMLVLPAFTWIVRTLGGMARSVREFLRESKVFDRWLKLLPALIGGAGLRLLLTNFGRVGFWLGRVVRLMLPIARMVLPWLALALAVDDLVTYLQGGESALGDLLDALFGVGAAQQVLENLKALWLAIGFGIEQVGEDIAALWERLGGWAGILESIKGGFAAFFDWIVSFLVAGPIEKVQMLFGLLEKVWAFIGKIGDGIKNFSLGGVLEKVAQLGSRSLAAPTEASLGLNPNSRSATAERLAAGGPAVVPDTRTPVLPGAASAPPRVLDQSTKQVIDQRQVSVTLNGKNDAATVKTATSEAHRLAGPGPRTQANALIRGAV